MNSTLNYALRQIHMDSACFYAFSCTNTEEHRPRSNVAVPPANVGSVLSSVPNSPSQPEKQDEDDGNFEERSLARNDYKINTTLLRQREEKRRSIRDWFSSFDSVFNTCPNGKDMF